MDRRIFIIGTAISGLSLLTIKPSWAFGMFGSKKKEFPFQLSDKEWRARLTEEQYRILRSDGTEASCSSPLNEYAEPGNYYCVGCGHLLFSSKNKFHSESGWPSFYQPADEYAVGTSVDFKLGYPRTEVHCANCGGHLGHVFEDGPEPTGLRYCINGTVLEFEAEKSENPH